MFDRFRVMRGLKKLLRSGLQVTDTIPSDTIVVVSRETDHDEVLDKKVWHLHGNQSVSRGLECASCHEKVVTSNNVYSKILTGEVKASQLRCFGCVKTEIL